MTITITSVKQVKKNKRSRSLEGIDPQDIDPDTNEPYADYSSPCIEPHPFGGGILASDY